MLKEVGCSAGGIIVEGFKSKGFQLENKRIQNSRGTFRLQKFIRGNINNRNVVTVNIQNFIRNLSVTQGFTNSTQKLWLPT